MSDLNLDKDTALRIALAARAMPDVEGIVLWVFTDYVEVYQAVEPKINGRLFGRVGLVLKVAKE